MQLKGSPGTGLSGATLGFFVGFAAVALFGPTAETFQQVMHLTGGEVGFLVAIPSLSGSLLRIPFGAWVDANGGRKPFLVLLGLGWLGMVGLSLMVYFLYPDGMTAALYPLLLILGFLVGCAIATFSVGIGQVSYWFPQSKQGTALAMYGGLGNLAPGIFSLLLPIALSYWGLAASYLTWLLFLTIGILLYWLLGTNAYYFQLTKLGLAREQAVGKAREMGQEIFPRGLSGVEGLLQAVKIGRTWVLVAAYFITFGGFIAMTAWLPTYWYSYIGVSTVSAGVLTALYSITASLVRVWGGSLADRIGGARTGMLAGIIMLVGAIIMFSSSNYFTSVMGEMLMAAGMGTGNAAVFKIVPQAVPEAVGGASGLVGGLGAFGGFIIPPLLGFIVDLQGVQGYASGFVIYVILAGASILLMYSLSRATTDKTENPASHT